MYLPRAADHTCSQKTPNPNTLPLRPTPTPTPTPNPNPNPNTLTLIRCKKKKIVNCGAVGFTLQTASPRGVALAKASPLSLRHRIDPNSISVIYGGFAAK